MTLAECNAEWLGLSRVSRAQLGIRRGHYETQQLAATDVVVGLQATRLARNQAPVDSSGALWSAVEYSAQWWSAVTGELSEGSVGDWERTLVRPIGALQLLCIFYFSEDQQVFLAMRAPFVDGRTDSVVLSGVKIFKRIRSEGDGDLLLK